MPLGELVNMERPAPFRIYVDHPSRWCARSQHTEGAGRDQSCPGPRLPGDRWLPRGGRSGTMSGCAPPCLSSQREIRRRTRNARTGYGALVIWRFEKSTTPVIGRRPSAPYSTGLAAPSDVMSRPRRASGSGQLAGDRRRGRIERRLGAGGERMQARPASLGAADIRLASASLS
jgi:hypothetical protein